MIGWMVSTATCCTQISFLDIVLSLSYGGKLESEANVVLSLCITAVPDSARAELQHEQPKPRLKQPS